MEEQRHLKIEVGFGLNMPKTPIAVFCLTILNDLNLNFLGSNFESSSPGLCDTVCPGIQNYAFGSLLKCVIWGYEMQHTHM